MRYKIDKEHFSYCRGSINIPKLPKDLPAGDAVELAIALLARVARGKPDRVICQFEDGRKDWMVRHDKYSRVKAQNFELKQENARLRAIIEKFTS